MELFIAESAACEPPPLPTKTPLQQGLDTAFAFEEEHDGKSMEIYDAISQDDKTANLPYRKAVSRRRRASTVSNANDGVVVTYHEDVGDTARHETAVDPDKDGPFMTSTYSESSLPSK